MIGKLLTMSSRIRVEDNEFSFAIIEECEK